MQNKPNYIEQANVTMSGEWHGGNITKRELTSVLGACVSYLEDLDKIKKALFYGRSYTNIVTYGHTLENLPVQIGLTGKTIAESTRLIHGIIGIATEAGELLEALLSSIENETELDVVNLCEEVGDTLWYQAAILRVAGTTFEKVGETNIAKLRERFGDKFSEFDANNRDLEAERAILEAGLEADIQHHDEAVVFPVYQSDTLVQAIKIGAIGLELPEGESLITKGKWMIHPEDQSFKPFQVSQSFIKKHDPCQGGYYVIYQDGYTSYSPAQAFEEGYKLFDEFPYIEDSHEIDDFK